MRLEVIDRDKWFFSNERNRLRSGEPYDHAPDQTRSGGTSYTIERRKAQLRIEHGSPDDYIERLYMCPRRDLRHDTAEGGMLIDLAEHNIRQNVTRTFRRPFHHRRASLVTSRFNAEHDHRCLTNIRWRRWVTLHKRDAL